MQSDSLVTVLQSVGTVVWQAAKRQIYIDLTVNFIFFLGASLLLLKYLKPAYTKVKGFLLDNDNYEDGPLWFFGSLIFGLLYILVFSVFLSSVLQTLNPDMAAFNYLMGR